MRPPPRQQNPTQFIRRHPREKREAKRPDVIEKRIEFEISYVKMNLISGVDREIRNRIEAETPPGYIFDRGNSKMRSFSFPLSTQYTIDAVFHKIKREPRP